ncbi:MAG TPA: DNA polymerase/3'-5' exonuclease PolX [Phenylobacterium sp.]|nr:DNA polymerase/3'-5' exonuclease PolX [Phenylobacterium sp.]
MAAHNADVAALFYRMAELLEIEGANPFRVRAYRRAAATIEDLPEPVADLIARGGDLDDLPGIGEDLAGKIKEICETGRLTALEEVEARTPSALAALAAVPGLGPKRVQALHERLGVNSVADLLKAAQEGRVRGLPRFGAALEARLLAELRKSLPAGERRIRISTAEDFALPLKSYLERLPGVREVVVAGSFRRRKETVGDLDILAVASEGQATTDGFAAYDEVAQVVAKGPTRATVLLQTGLQVDLRVVPAESFGAALVYFTGSKDHNIALRRLAQKAGLKISEYGVFRGEERLAGRTEAEVYASVGLPWIPPELREDRGEIDAAFAGRLPRLVELCDIRGDLHVHTRASDGRSTLAEMVEAARALGYEYLAISDHSKHATVAHGLDAARLSAQIDEIDRLNATGPGVRVLKSCEVDILPDGRLDLPNAVLARLDFVIGAVHSNFNLSAEAQTARVLRAMDNPYFDIFAHPIGRLIGERPGYEIDLPKVMAAARARGCLMEINAHPSRLDLDDVQARAAKEMGLKVAIGSDAHSTPGLSAMRHGVDQARRGWLEAADVVNTRPWSELEPLLAR